MNILNWTEKRLRNKELKEDQIIFNVSLPWEFTIQDIFRKNDSKILSANAVSAVQ